MEKYLSSAMRTLGGSKADESDMVVRPGHHTGFPSLYNGPSERRGPSEISIADEACSARHAPCTGNAAIVARGSNSVPAGELEETGLRKGTNAGEEP